MWVITECRLQIFDKNLKFQLRFDNSRTNYPLDVKLTNELVIILNKTDPCIHIFTNSDHSLVNSIISRGPGKQVGKVFLFIIGPEVNIIMTDFEKHCVSVVSKSGECISQICKAGTFSESLSILQD